MMKLNGQIDKAFTLKDKGFTLIELTSENINV